MMHRTQTTGHDAGCKHNFKYDFTSSTAWQGERYESHACNQQQLQIHTLAHPWSVLAVCETLPVFPVTCGAYCVDENGGCV
jgi:hypothetical protein